MSTQLQFHRVSHRSRNIRNIRDLIQLLQNMINHSRTRKRYPLSTRMVWLACGDNNTVICRHNYSSTGCPTGLETYAIFEISYNCYKIWSTIHVHANVFLYPQEWCDLLAAWSHCTQWLFAPENATAYGFRLMVHTPHLKTVCTKQI
jgi:hypothetical protein